MLVNASCIREGSTPWFITWKKPWSVQAEWTRSTAIFVDGSSPFKKPLRSMMGALSSLHELDLSVCGQKNWHGIETWLRSWEESKMMILLLFSSLESFSGFKAGSCGGGKR